MATALIIAYFVTLGALALLGLYRIVLTAWALRARPLPSLTLQPGPPKLVVQLPLYNEAFVAERLIRAAARLRYPNLEIQVLDDSTDETTQIVAKLVEELEGEVAIRHLRRPERTGYKAGALAFGLTQTDAELVAIFDADFLPDPAFLERTVPHLLADPKHGLVQARWHHENREASWLTRAQAVFLDGHFAVEHRGRHRAGHLFNFNGTAGVWRRAAIEEAGGWRSDTITEDLDLSYRAQLAGWRFVYADDVAAPAELPESWSAFRAQQARWVRGSIETARLHLAGIARARKLGLFVQLDAAVHLTNNLAYLLMAVLAALLPACVIVRDEIGWRIAGGQALLSILDLTMLTAGTFAMFVFYLTAAKLTDRRVTLHRWLEILFALCIGAGMSISNAREVLRGLRSKQSEFVRTPKRGGAPLAQALVRYRPLSANAVAFFELLFAAYFLVGVVYAVYWSLWGALPFLTLYLVGFATVGASTWWERRALQRGAASALTPAATPSR